MSVIWKESSDPVDIEVIDTSLLSVLSARALKIEQKLHLSHLKSLFCFADKNQATYKVCESVLPEHTGTWLEIEVNWKET